MIRPSLTLACLALSSILFAADDVKMGHSKHGSAFDTGMRLKPWKMDGIGFAPFTITTKSPEVQTWFNQGNALLHSFWFEEAERSFRWCHKLEPENAMVYFGLAQCGLNWFSAGEGESPRLQRYREFLKEAMKRRATVSDRERMYIEAWDAAWSKKDKEARKEIVTRLQKICVTYPEDIEAKCQLAFYNIGEGSELANDFLIQQVLRVNPRHPGAHHARIHNWDSRDSEQALDSCEIYGTIAPGIGHALHMPGHIDSKVGLWHEAAIAMDSATRIELRYMNERLALPFETWNYAHNRDYLCYIQEQLGRGNASIQGALDMIHAPRDPGNMQGSYPAVFSLIRGLLKFERWSQLLDESNYGPPGDPYIGLMKDSAQAFALSSLGQVKEARAKVESVKAGLTKMVEADVAKSPEKAATIRKEFEDSMPFLIRAAEAKVLIAEGQRLEGIRLLMETAKLEKIARETGKYSNDPPFDPWPVMRIIGDVYLEGKDYSSAVEAYETGLKQEVNDGWCLAGLAKCYAALGQTDKARTYAGRLQAVWDGADPDLRWVREVNALGLNAKPIPVIIRPERAYDPAALDIMGPSNWTPFAAPKLECLNINGKPVKLEDYRGQNVLLVFYLSDQCAHCMEQLAAINKRINEFEATKTVVLAVSGAKPEANKMSTPTTPFKIKLLTDVNHVNARRFASFDDFEDMELHSTILIDKKGLVRWKRTGGDPFTDVDFLLGEIGRWPK